MVFKNMEEMFYKFLKRDREFNNPRWPFLIKVRDVAGQGDDRPDVQAARPATRRTRTRST